MPYRMKKRKQTTPKKDKQLRRAIKVAENPRRKGKKCRRGQELPLEEEPNENPTEDEVQDGDDEDAHSQENDDEEEHVDVEAAAGSIIEEIGTNAKARKGRGRTLCHELLTSKTKRVLEWDENEKAIGENCSKLASLCGQLVRNRNVAPLQIKGWHQMPQDRIRVMLDKISDYFIVAALNTPVDVCLKRRRYLIRKLNALYREYRSELHVVYKERHTNSAKLKKLLRDVVTKEDWDYLVAYWSSDNFQGMSSRNAQNREKLNMVSCTGRTSFSEVENKLTMKHGRKPTHLEMFLETRKRQDGTLDGAAQDKLVRVEEIRKKYEEDELHISDDEIFKEVFGGRKACKGPCREVGGSSSGRRSSLDEESKEKLDEALKMVENAEKRAAESEKKVAELEAKYEAMMNLMSEKLGG